MTNDENTGDRQNGNTNPAPREGMLGEIDAIIDSRVEFIERHYHSIREAYQNHYDWPELDPLRDEISICIMFGLCQAAITLTNHFLESLLKYSLIILDGKNKKHNEPVNGKILTTFLGQHEEGIRKYGDANLDKTINRACTVGLITKDQKTQLHQFRERFRNAFGHSDKKKIFGDSTVPVTSARLGDKKFELDEKGEPNIAELIIGQGLIQAMMAQEDAPPYFLYIDKLARDIRDQLFDSSDSDD